MRGKEFQVIGCTDTPGITPAYAGKSGKMVTYCGPQKDHPRVCGEKLSYTQLQAIAVGSPPRMRGKDRCGAVQSRLQGITPAYAGKSECSRCCCVVAWDHPRVCGEKSRYRGFTPVPRGSPPRMRGKVDSIETGDLVHGITPAYAGKSAFAQCAAGGARDHPRVCGEKRCAFLVGVVGDGSPPRMRGKAGYWVKDAQGRGITPAYAGKSGRLLPLACVAGDHPRVCGEKTKKIP